MLTIRALIGLGRGLHTHRGRRLRAIRRRHPITEIVLHESVSVRLDDDEGNRIGGGYRNPEDILAERGERGLGVHYVVQYPDDGDSDVRITDHVDVEMATVHAGSWHNRRSIAVEVENRYRPADGDDAADRATDPLTGAGDVLIGRWVWKRRRRHRHRVYLVPPIAQLEALWTLVSRLCLEHDVPMAFPGVDPERGFRWGRSAHHKEPGVKAHYRWHHADALVPECYCWLRSLDLEMAEAYVSTVELASAGRKWTLGPLGRGVALVT